MPDRITVAAVDHFAVCPSVCLWRPQSVTRNGETEEEGDDEGLRFVR